MSRLRKLDRDILDQASLLDTDEQKEIISSLSSENAASYKTYKQYLFVVVLVQLPIIILLDLRRKAVLSFTLIVLSNAMSIASIKYPPPHNFNFDNKYAKWLASNVVRVNGLIALRLLFVFASLDNKLQGLYYLLPAINVSNNVLLDWWFTKIKRDVNGLNNLVYKYKSV